MASLYELTGAAYKLRELMEEGELDPEAIKDAIENNNEEISLKLENCAKVIKDIESDIAGLKAEEARLAERRKSYENNVKALKSKMQEALLATGERKVKSPLFTFYVQKNNPSVVIDEAYIENIPEQYLVTREPEVNKKKMLEDLKAGVDLDGIAHLETSESIRIK